MSGDHFSCMPGKRVLVKLKDGTTFIDKFVDRKGKWLHFEAHPRIRREKVKMFTLYKGATYERNPL
jgi:hypothetical protein